MLFGGETPVVSKSTLVPASLLMKPGGLRLSPWRWSTPLQWIRSSAAPLQALQKRSKIRSNGVPRPRGDDFMNRIYYDYAAPFRFRGGLGPL